MAAYYNEIDNYAAQWLRNLIAAGHIADGVVDERSITEVTPDDVRGFTQCHFFAGIGGWSYALRLAGWDDARPVWTGSCPCQPFSVAGQGRGSDDERHLWPAFHSLIRECHPATVFGEQVAGANGLAWLDHVFADLEESGYSAAAADICAAGVGAPHIRQRLYWLADSDNARLERRRGSAGGAAECVVGARGLVGGPASFNAGQPDPLDGFWRDADWLYCRDGKWRPVEPGTFPLVDGLPAGVGRVHTHQERLAALPRKDQGNRTGRLKGYGNAIVPQVAAEFIGSAMECMP